MRKVLSFATTRIVVFTLLCDLIISCGNIINTNYDSHFTDDGILLKDSTESVFELQHPSKIKFYVEVSGSMNGFFRANRPTHFKADLWNVLSYYSPIAPEICILTNDGNEGASLPQSQFQTLMNTGAFISSASTKVPVMLQSIINNLDTEAGEVAVLVSDMKYSPVGAAAPAVLMTQYSTDVSKILGEYGRAVSLVCATSNYLDKAGNEVCSTSPYYYFIIGNQEHVADIRNGISTLLENREHFVDNIESGFNFVHPKYSFGISNRCEQLSDEPTFVDYEEAEDGDTCTVKLKVNLENYRWILATEPYFRNAFTAKTLYGSEIKIGNVVLDVQNITGNSKELKRIATATVEIKLYNMATDSEVIEWNLELPDTDHILFDQFFNDAIVEEDPSKSYSVLDFVKGMFYGSVVNKKLNPNYILISKNS